MILTWCAHCVCTFHACPVAHILCYTCGNIPSSWWSRDSKNLMSKRIAFSMILWLFFLWLKELRDDLWIFLIWRSSLTKEIWQIGQTFFMMTFWEMDALNCVLLFKDFPTFLYISQTSGEYIIFYLILWLFSFFFLGYFPVAIWNLPCFFKSFFIFKQVFSTF